MEFIIDINLLKLDEDENGFDLNQEVGPNYLYGLLDNPSRVAIHYSHRVSAILVTIVWLFGFITLCFLGNNSFRM